MTDSKATGDALNRFADHWKLDGDYLRCNKCKRPQQVSWALHPFPHASGCKLTSVAASDPWRVLGGLISAAISKAKYPDEVSGP